MQSDPIQVKKEPPLEQLNDLIGLFNEGRHEAVEFQARAILEEFPASGFAWNILGAALQAQRKDSLFALQKAVELLPGEAEANCNLGVALENTGQLEKAEARYREALSIDPKFAPALKNLGNILRAQGRLDLAEKSYLEALKAKPLDSDTRLSLGKIQQDLRKFDLAEVSFRTVLHLHPGHANAHNLLGGLFLELGEPQAAEFEYRQAVALAPENAWFHCNLGLAEQKLGRIESAIAENRQAIEFDPNLILAHYNLGVSLHDIGRCEEAIASFQRALQLNPGFADASNGLAVAYRELGHLEEAIGSYSATLAIDPSNAQANLMLKAIYMQQKRLVDAEELCRKALDINPDFAEMRQNLALTLAYMSDYKNVIEESDRAFKINPDHSVMWEQRLYSFSYHPDLSADEIFREFVAWGNRFPDPETDFGSHDRNPDRRLRIGYVSPDFRGHSSRFYFWPLFSNHNREAFEIFAYSNVKIEDAWTHRFQSEVEHWRDIRNRSDQSVAKTIQEDGIDILVDCCSHMKDDRLGVFTLKPAPIQVTWLGAAWTTGLKTVDYVLFDPFIAPEGTLARESIIRLPNSFLAYQPPDQTADLSPAPCLKNGYFTFGYSGRTERLNHRTFWVWGEILKHVKDARLILDYGSFADPRTQAYYSKFLGHYGIDTSRVILRNSTNIFAGLNDIDILLDSFPHSGGTMLMDAFWMGVPALTLASRPPLGRIGASMLSNLDLPEWIAATETEYVEKACRFASEPRALNDLRLGMRVRMQQSPLMDGFGFARGVEAAYRAVFDRWMNDSIHPQKEASRQRSI